MSTPRAWSETAPENAVEHDVAVIDIGSNSVRLVHFRLEGRALWPVYNEKVMAGLGLGLTATGKLNPDGVKLARRALSRFVRLLDAKHVMDRHVVATAAVREAKDGEVFAARIKRETGLDVNILSGEEEGRLSALGLVAGVPGAHGVMGDLGGSSLELTPLKHGRPQPGVTLPLGPQAAPAGADWNRKAAKAVIEERLGGAEAFLPKSGGTFYAVGGAWRALAFLSMAIGEAYPLRVVHGYALSAAEVMRLVEFAERQSSASLSGVRGVSSRRADTLPYAALLLRRIMKRGKFERVVFSAYGVREGALMDLMPPALREADPLIAGAEALTRPAAPTPGFGRALEDWLSPALDTFEPVFSARRDQILRAAAARLADLGARMHPDHRADLVRESVLYAPFAGINHPERVYLASAMHHRYSGRRSALESEESLRLLNQDQRDAAYALGLALRLGASLAGRSEGLLGHFRLEATGEALILHAEESAADLLMEKSEDLLAALATALGRRAEIEVS